MSTPDSGNGEGHELHEMAPPLPSEAHHRLPTPPDSPRKSLDFEDNHAQQSRAKAGDTKSCASTNSKQDYLESLNPPSQEEFDRIAQKQADREREKKRWSHDLKHWNARRSVDEQTRRRSTSRDGKRSLGSMPASVSSLFKRSSVAGGEAPKSSEDVAAHGSTRASMENAHSTRHRSVDGIQGLQKRAATLIQRTYRGYRTRRQMKGLGIDANTRWSHALSEARFRELTRPRARAEVGGIGEGKEEATHREGSDTGHDRIRKSAEDERHAAVRFKWKKAAAIARRAAVDMDGDDTEYSSSDDEDVSDDALHQTGTPPDQDQRKSAHLRREEAKVKRRNAAKTMGLQYFLEMVDLKHRYGSNLRSYHEEWKKADTHENFFYWLDYGDGKNVEVTGCPRERLDREQVRYLSREERQYYLVKVDEQGRLCWAKNGELIDTTEKWKDSIHGIVPADDSTPAFSPSNASAQDQEADTSDSEREADRAAKYANPGLDGAKGVKKVTHISAGTIFNTLLRKSVRKNTWIFVADTSFRLYVGIKDSGAFQHSSFLQGSRISAAGLIKIKNGKLDSLSPLSGHYRPPASNFRAFVHSLKETGVNMKHVSISKSYVVLLGLEAYVKTRKRGKHLVQKVAHAKDHLVHPDEVEQRKEAERDKSESAARERAVLEEQARQRADERSPAQVMKRLHLQPVQPASARDAVETKDSVEQEEVQVLDEVGAQADHEQQAKTESATEPTQA